jgi:hypothetical protein
MGVLGNLIAIPNNFDRNFNHETDEKYETHEKVLADGHHLRTATIRSTEWQWNALVKWRRGIFIKPRNIRGFVAEMAFIIFWVKYPAISREIAEWRGWSGWNVSRGILTTKYSKICEIREKEPGNSRTIYCFTPHWNVEWRMSQVRSAECGMAEIKKYFEIGDKRRQDMTKGDNMWQKVTN